MSVVGCVELFYRKTQWIKVDSIENVALVKLTRPTAKR